MTKLAIQAAAGLAFFIGTLAAALFVGGGTTHYWQAWLYLAVFTGCVLVITIDLAVRDPALLERRVKAGPVAEPSAMQKLIQSIAGLAFLAVFVVSALDHRFGWSQVSVEAVAAGDVLVALGLAIVFFVFRANTFTSATVEVSEDQQLVSTGPYGVVRHPMYSGALVMLLGTPLALGSWRGLAAVPVLAAVIVWRLLDEERLLTRELAGYADYAKRVRRRLVPFVW